MMCRRHIKPECFSKIVQIVLFKNHTGKVIKVKKKKTVAYWHTAIFPTVFLSDKFFTLCAINVKKNVKKNEITSESLVV